MVVAAGALRRLLRDRMGLFFVIIFPLPIILIIGVSFFPDEFAGFRVGVISQGSGELGAELVESMDSSRSVQLTPYDDLEAMRADIRREVLVAGFVVPDGYTEDLHNQEQAAITFLSNPRRQEAGQTVRAVVAAEASEQGALVKAANFASAQTGKQFQEMLDLAASLPDDAGLTIETEVAGQEGEGFPIPGGFSYPAASNLILFTFITSLAGAGAIIAARRRGITRRMLATPTSSSTILMGEAAGRFVIAAFQAAFIFAVAKLLFDASFGDIPAALTLIFLFSLVSTGAAMLLATMFRTEEQAGAIGPPIGIGLGMLGGCMWPLEVVGDTMRAVGHVTPHAWAMDGFVDLIGRGGGFADIATELAVLGLFAVGLLVVSTLRLRRALTA